MRVTWSLAWLLSTTAPAWAQSVVADGPDHVSVRATGVPLEQVLRELAAITPMEIEIDPIAAGVPVTIRIEDVLVEQAIQKVLRSSGVDIVVLGLDRSRVSTAIRIVAGNPQDAVALSEDGKVESAEPVAYATPPAFLPEPAIDEKAEAPDDPFATGDPYDGGIGPSAATLRDMAAQEQMLHQALVPAQPTLRQTGGMAVLPFPDSDGRPIVVPVAPAASGGTALIPGSDPDGRPVAVPVSPRSDGLVMLPFANDDESPVLVPAAPLLWDPSRPATSPAPGVIVAPSGTPRPPPE